MKEGFWLNCKTGRSFQVRDHEQWIREPGNGRRLGVPADVMSNSLRRFQPTADRDAFLAHVMCRAPVLRIRGHGAYATFEHGSKGDQTIAIAIRRFGRRHGFGPMLGIYVFSFTTSKGAWSLWRDITNGANTNGTGTS